MPAAKLYNLARMTTATTGTGAITLGAAVTDFLTFAQAGVADGETITYAIEDGTKREMGRGVYTHGTLSLTRSVKNSSAGGTTPITLSGSAQVFIAVSAEDMTGYDETALSYSSGGTTAWNCSTAPVATVAISGGNTTMGAPSGVVEGRVYTIRFTQDTTTRTVAWNSAYKWSGGLPSVPVITPTSGAVDRFTFIGRASNVLEEIGRAQGIA